MHSNYESPAIQVVQKEDVQVPFTELGGEPPPAHCSAIVNRFATL